MGEGNNMVTNVFDSKGRLALGSQYAGRTALVIVREDGSILIEPAAVIPEQEVWLYANPVALERVREGLREARDHQFAQPAPDLKADDEMFSTELR